MLIADTRAAAEALQQRRSRGKVAVARQLASATLPELIAVCSSSSAGPASFAETTRGHRRRKRALCGDCVSSRRHCELRSRSRGRGAVQGARPGRSTRGASPRIVREALPKVNHGAARSWRVRSVRMLCLLSPAGGAPLRRKPQ